MNNILVIGGAGYIGSFVCHTLYFKGYNPIVFDNLSNGHKEAVRDYIFEYGNYGNYFEVSSVLKKYNIKIVVHLGAYASVPDSVKNPDKYYDNNVCRMKNLLTACVDHKVKYFIFSSSAAVYGTNYKIFKEDQPLNPINPYGWTKFIGEKMLEDFSNAYGLKYCAFRYFCAAGAGMGIGEAHNPETHLIPVMIKKAINKEPLSIFGNFYNTIDGTCVRDFVHVIDIANAHVLAIDYLKDNNNEIFNLGSGNGYSILEIIYKFNEFHDRTPINFQFVESRKGDPDCLIADITKAKEILGWYPNNSDIYHILDSAYKWEEERLY